MQIIKYIFSLITFCACLTQSLNAQSWLTNGLVAYYPFNGDASDASGNSCDGVISNATFATDRFGYSNSACFFNGSNSFIIVTNTLNLSPTGDFTVSLWVNPANFSSLPMVLISKSSAYDDPDSSWFIAYEPPPVGNNSGIQFQANPNFASNSPTILAPPAWQWHQLVYTYTRDSNSCASYLDGHLVDMRSEAYSTNDPNLMLTIGCQEYFSYYKYFFNGAMDDIRIYNRALSQSEAVQLFQLESPQVVSINKAVWLSFSNLRNGTNYQVQISSDLSQSFTNYGLPFTATNPTMGYPIYWNVADWNQLFFRLEALP